ncbi:MAG: hypothetical protein QOG79_8015 [Mycobacterium sp.]|jgi:hypothetical protein|nr:hypothetical protein [Mycobacterium sp.]MDT5318595.1 hypothetical protein [Mycobacterium sp.]
MFCFAGRRANLHLQLRYVRSILAKHTELEYHVWNLARNSDDDHYVRGIEGERITVVNDLYGGDPWRCFADVYRYYAARRFSDRLFVKIDDDVVFVEANQFASFIAAATGNRQSVISATVINNAACTAVDPQLNAAVRPWECPCWSSTKAQRSPRSATAIFTSIGHSW